MRGHHGASPEAVRVCQMRGVPGGEGVLAEVGAGMSLTSPARRALVVAPYTSRRNRPGKGLK